MCLVQSLLPCVILALFSLDMNQLAQITTSLRYSHHVLLLQKREAKKCERNVEKPGPHAPSMNPSKPSCSIYNFVWWLLFLLWVEGNMHFVTYEGLLISTVKKQDKHQSFFFFKFNLFFNVVSTEGYTLAWSSEFRLF